jgi:hypothetical protein
MMMHSAQAQASKIKREFCSITYFFLVFAAAALATYSSISKAFGAASSNKFTRVLASILA